MQAVHTEEQEVHTAEAEVFDSLVQQGRQAIEEVQELDQHIVDSAGELLTDRWLTLPQRIGLKTVEMLGLSGIPENPLLSMRVNGGRVILSLTKSLPKELLIPITWEGAAIRLGGAVLSIAIVGISISNVVHSFQNQGQNNAGEKQNVNYESVGWWRSNGEG